MAAYLWGSRELGLLRLARLKNLLGVFVGAVLFFTLIYHLTNLYITQHHGIARFILVDGGIFTWMFWGGHVLIGSLVPLVLVYIPPFSESRNAVATASFLVLVGAFFHIYVIVIGGQAFPMTLFPGQEVLESSFLDGMVAEYVPSLPEALLGIAGIAIAMTIVAVVARMMRVLPEHLLDPETES